MKPYFESGSADNSNQLIAEGFMIVPPPELVTQGMIVLAHVSFPKYVIDPKTQEKVVERRGNIETYESKARPVLVVSKEVNAFGEIVVVPLTTKEYQTHIGLIDWETSNLAQRSSANIHAIKSIRANEILKLIGYVSEIDKARILMSIYNIF